MSKTQTPTKPISLFWFRNDLRVADNTALWNATQKGPVIALYTLTPEQWKSHDMAQIKIDFIRSNLVELESQLAKLKIPLLLQVCPDFNSVPNTLVEIAKATGATSVFWNRENLVNELKRDSKCKNKLNSAGIECQSYEDALIIPPGFVLNGSGQMYKVFTPFFRNWFEQVQSLPPELLHKPEPQEPTGFDSDSVHNCFDQISPALATATAPADRWPAGEVRALERLSEFVAERVGDYEKYRDIPLHDGTSSLSAYLSLGVISARQCLIASETGVNAEPWKRQLAWRDFYNHLVCAYPDIVRGKPFQSKTEKIRWRESRDDFEAWTEGRTGQPFVDAGMRQLKQTGWMHNRLRMITAMFLTKNLFIDWHLGERHFMQNLIDGDFALNNGGWQWSASTGTDAAPYFRIFNPFSQSKRFDPNGDYIRTYLPELREVSIAALHDPSKLEKERPSNYPSLIVDVKSSRKSAIETFSSLL